MFEFHKKVLTPFIKDYLVKKQKELKTVNIWGEDVCGRLLNFILNGKMIRGGLVLESYLVFKENISESAVRLASVVELIHSSLLIHDDIMDRDIIRRGSKTLVTQFEDVAKKNKLASFNHFGISMGISAGDLGFFLGYELISGEIPLKIISKISKELSIITVAQMQDFYGGFSDKEFSKEEILSIYLHKTGRYSLSLPLYLGAILAGQSESTLKIIEKFGEYAGIIFQIKDDELGIFGDTEETGKPIGSDIRENKKTIFRHFLYKLASGKEKKELDKIFGNPNLSEEQIKCVQNLIKKLGILKKIDEITQNLYQKSKNLIPLMRLPGKGNRAFLAILDYNLSRKK